MIELSDKKFVEYIEKKVRQTIRKYKLIKKGSKLAVAVSGGKDSTVCLYILSKLRYEIEAITIDPSIEDYTSTHIDNLKELCNKNQIPLHIIPFKTDTGIAV